MHVRLSDVLAIARRNAPWVLRVSGTSMRPRILPGDRLEVRPRDTIRFGDVVVFARGGSLVAHRVLKAAAVLVTAGDASRGSTEYVERRDVLGVGDRVFRSGMAPFRPRSVPAALALRARIGLKYYLRMKR